jgi:hypothetical protein
MEREAFESYRGSLMDGVLSHPYAVRYKMRTQNNFPPKTPRYMNFLPFWAPGFFVINYCENRKMDFLLIFARLIILF